MRRTFALAALAVVASAAVVVTGGRTALACSCTAASDEAYLDQADAVFVGTVLVRRDVPVPDPLGSGSADWTFAVEAVIKGSVPSARAEMRTSLNTPACGYVFEVGKRYRVYARVVDGRLTTSLCSGTVLADAPPPAPTTIPSRTATSVRLTLTG